MNRFYLAAGLGLSTALALSACGGATTDSTTYSSGLPPTKPIGDLTAADDEQLCSSLLGFLKDSPGDAFCHFTGLLQASLDHAFLGSANTEADVRRVCADAEASCEHGFTGGSTHFTCKAPPLGSNCAATVKEFEACVTEELGAIEKLAATIPDCGSLTLADVEPKTGGGQTVASDVDLNGGTSCRGLEERCPEVFTTSSSSSGFSGDGSSSSGGFTSGTRDAGFAPTCGNGQVEPGEECDRVVTTTCGAATMGAFQNGTVACSATCQFDLSGCGP